MFEGSETWNTGLEESLDAMGPISIQSLRSMISLWELQEKARRTCIDSSGSISNERATRSLNASEPGLYAKSGDSVASPTSLTKLQ